MAIVSRIPPPFGGVSVHVSRLLDRLADEGIPYRFYDLSGRSDPRRHIVPARKSASWLLRFLLTCREAAVHFHTNHIPIMALASTLLPLRGRQALLTLHSASPKRWYEQAGPLNRYIWRNCLSRAGHVLCVNEALQQWALDLGCRPERTSIAPGFIPPRPAEVDRSNLPPEVTAFLRTHGPILGSHGHFGYFVNGVHVYSFDMLPRLVHRLRSVLPQVGLYTVVSGCYEDGHRNQIYALRRQLGLESSWLILEQPFSAVSLFARTDLFIRPSITDGDSVSVRECLSLGVPVVASDSVARPAPCVLFRNRDADSLFERVLSVLTHHSQHRLRCAAEPTTDFSAQVCSLYARVLEEGRVMQTPLPWRDVC